MGIGTYMVRSLCVLWACSCLLGMLQHDWLAKYKREPWIESIKQAFPWTSLGHVMYDECLDCTHLPKAFHYGLTAGLGPDNVCSRQDDGWTEYVKERSTCSSFCASRGAVCRQACDSSGRKRCVCDEQPFSAQHCERAWGTKVCDCAGTPPPPPSSDETSPAVEWRPTAELLPWTLNPGYSESAATVRLITSRTLAQDVCRETPYTALLHSGEVRNCGDLNLQVRIQQQFPDTPHTRAELDINDLTSVASMRAIICCVSVVGVGLLSLPALLAHPATTHTWGLWAALHVSSLTHFLPCLVMHAEWCFAPSQGGIFAPWLRPYARMDLDPTTLHLITHATIGMCLLAIALSSRVASIAFHGSLLWLAVRNTNHIITLGLLAVWAIGSVLALFPMRNAQPLIEWYTLISTMVSGMSKWEAGWPWHHHLGCFSDCEGIFRAWIQHIPQMYRGALPDQLLSGAAVCVEVAIPALMLFTAPYAATRPAVRRLYTLLVVLYLGFFATIFTTMPVPPLFVGLYTTPHIHRLVTVMTAKPAPPAQKAKQQ